MVVGTKISTPQDPRRSRASLRLQKFTVQKRHSILTIVYGSLLIVSGMVMIIVDPIQIFTDWYMEMREGSFMFKVYEKPPYQIFTEVWVFNYTNVPEYLDGSSKVLKVKEIGPFKFKETRTNEDMRIDKDRGVLIVQPNITLSFMPEESIAHYEDVHITTPNVALIAISTLAADKLGYLANAGAYYSISALGSKLFRSITAEEVLWGYNDPVVTIANRLLPGWIDFGKIGILDRFYAKRKEYAEIELRNISRRFSIHAWNDSPGLVEQGFTDLNTSIPCNRIKGSYEGLLLSPKVSKDMVIPIFRRQACRIYPFVFDKEITGEFGFNYYRFSLTETSFNYASDYACKCTENCLPDGFVDISKCYYGFPIALSKPHFLNADPAQQAAYEGMHPDIVKHGSYLDVEPTIGVPLSVFTRFQVNVAVRTNAGNPITAPLKNKVVPIIWIALYCKEPPPQIIGILNLRFAIAPPLVITVEVLLLMIGVMLGVQGCHRLRKQKYKLISLNKDIENRRDKKMKRIPNHIIILNTDGLDPVKEADDDCLSFKRLNA